MKGCKILVVDDDPSIRRVTAEMLEHLQHTVVSAATGSEALSLLARESFDLVLLDVLMPHMSGPEVYEQLRAQLPQQRVIFMTGYSVQTLDVSDSEHVSLLSKPFTMKALAGAVQEATA